MTTDDHNEQSIGWQEVERLQRGEATLLFRIVVAVFFVMLFGLMLNATLNYFNFRKNLTETVQATHHTVLEDIGFKAQTGVQLGLELASLSNLQALLDNAVRQNPGVEFVLVQDPLGKPVYDSYHSGQVSSLSSQVSALCRSPDPTTPDSAGESVLETAEGRLGAMFYPLLNSFNHTAGSICLGYSLHAQEQVEAAAMEQIVQDTSTLLFIFLVVLIVVVYLLLRRVRGNLQELHHEVAELEKALKSGAEIPEPHKADHGILQPLFRAGSNLGTSLGPVAKPD